MHARWTALAAAATLPYPPHHRIDITGFQPGQLARDPYTDKIFRVP